MCVCCVLVCTVLLLLLVAVEENQGQNLDALEDGYNTYSLP